MKDKRNKVYEHRMQRAEIPQDILTRLMQKLEQLGDNYEPNRRDSNSRDSRMRRSFNARDREDSAKSGSRSNSRGRPRSNISWRQNTESIHPEHMKWK